MTARRLPRLLAGLTLCAACTDRESVAPRPPEPVAAPTLATLVLSDSAAAVGSDVVLRVLAMAPDGRRVGSFTVRLLFDTTQLVVEEQPLSTDQALRAINPVPGAYRIAGAQATGFAPGAALVELRARRRGPHGFARLALAVDELHSVGSEDLTRTLEVRDGRAAYLQAIGAQQLPAVEREERR
jgi:hypothetical protein